jgi:hypothetical protein
MSSASQADPVAAADADAILAMMNRQPDEWNRPDIDAYLADCTTDVNWVTIVGRHLNSREAVRQSLIALHKGLFLSQPHASNRIARASSNHAWHHNSGKCDPHRRRRIASRRQALSRPGQYQNDRFHEH